MRYNAIQRCEYVNGNDIGVSLYVQGCGIRCKGCFNPETWDFEGGEEFDTAAYDKLIELLDKPYIARLSILGGEPLERRNWEDLDHLLFKVLKHNPDLKIWLYTGYDYEFIMRLVDEWRINWPKFNDAFLLESILEKVDVLVAGPFIQEQKDKSLPFRGSRNQKIIELQ